MTVKRYVCPTCGYEKAIWHIRLNLSRLDLCENCYAQYQTPTNHVCTFLLNTTQSKYFDVPEYVKMNAKILHNLRHGLGYSKNELATLTGVPEMMITSFEHGRIKPQKELYNRLAEFFEWEEWR